MSDDYISREAAIRVIDELYVKRPLDSDRFVLTGVGARLEELPSADVRPVVRGKWIKCDVEKWRNGALKCSECGKGYHLPHEVTLFDWNFCPNCGADMRGEQDDESRSNSNAQTDTRARGMGATDKSSGI